MVPRSVAFLFVLAVATWTLPAFAQAQVIPAEYQQCRTRSVPSPVAIGPGERLNADDAARSHT